MTITRPSGTGWILRMEREEKALFFRLLETFPVVRARLSPKGREDVPSERPELDAFLEEALAQHRAEARRKLKVWMEEPESRSDAEEGVTLRADADRMEWLLQMFNDIRVGNWMNLGSPADLNPPFESLSPDDLRYWMAMQTAGFFEVALLEALDGSPTHGSPGW